MANILLKKTEFFNTWSWYKYLFNTWFYIIIILETSPSSRSWSWITFFVFELLPITRTPGISGDDRDIRCCVYLRVRTSRGRNRCEAFFSKTPSGGAAFSCLLVLVPIVSYNLILIDLEFFVGFSSGNACHEFCSGESLSNNPFSTSQTLPSFTFCY